MQKPKININIEGISNERFTRREKPPLSIPLLPYHSNVARSLSIKCATLTRTSLVNPLARTQLYSLTHTPHNTRTIQTNHKEPNPMRFVLKMPRIIVIPIRLTNRTLSLCYVHSNGNATPRLDWAQNPKET